jgi:hemerythrin-like metal-binding protein
LLNHKILFFVLLFCIFSNCLEKKSAHVLQADANPLRLVNVAPKAIKGILDLRSWNLEKDGTIKLNGEWEFYWGELLEPPIDNSKFLIQNSKYISVPSSWNNFQLNGKPIGKEGFATYRLKVYLDKPLQGLTLKTDHIGTAYKLWVNGTLLAEAGKVSTEKENAKPGYLIKPFLLSESFQELDIILQVSNYHDRNGGFWRSLVLGANEDIANQTLANHFLSFFLFGCLFLMGIYHLGLYSLRKKDPSALWFGLFSLLLSFRNLLVGESILYALFPEYSILLHKIEYLTVYATLPLFVNFVHSIFSDEFHIKIKKWINLIGISSSLFIILSPSSFYTETLAPYQIFLLLACFHCTFVLIKAFQKKRMGAKIFLAGWIFAFATIVNDILHHQLIIYTFTLFPLGFFLFIISQAIVLSMRFSEAFNKSEELSSDLQSLTLNLENKISERVTEQQKYSECLLYLSKSKTMEEFGLARAITEVTETCAKILEIERCSVWVFNENGSEIICLNLFLSKENIHMKGKFTLKEVDFPVYFSFIREGALISASNLLTHPATKDFTENYSIPFNIRSLLDAPIHSGGRLLGIICCEQVAVQKNWTSEEENLVTGLANILASYFESSDRQQAFSELTETKQEIEDLNQFTHLVNSLSNLDDIFQEVSKYVYGKYNIAATWLFLLDERKENLYTHKAYSFKKIADERYNFLKNKKIPIQEKEDTLLNITFHRKKPFYSRKIVKFNSTIDREFAEALSVKSFLYVPLVRKDRCVGIFGFTNVGEDMILSKKQIQKLSNVCSQIAGTVDTNHLLQQVDKARKEIEKQKEQAFIERSIAVIAQNEAECEREKSEKLLLNILPVEVANELKEKGTVEPVYFENATILFTDFKDFTQIVESLTPQDLIKELDSYFSQFDQITGRSNLEKLKTIGDSYMCAGGIPRVNNTHAIDSCLAALEILSFINLMKEIKQANGIPYWEVRLGIHTGSAIAGVIGKNKFLYDVWGDTVNTASRMESSGTPGKINISHNTYEFVKDLFDCEYRGKVAAKNKGMMRMYYLNRIKKEYSNDEEGMVPNEKFWDAYKGERTSLNQKLVNKIQILAKEMNLLVGLQVIDTQHLWLYYLILELEELNANKNSIVVHRELKQISRELQNFVTEHFLLEEMLLEECRFDSMDSHIKMHRNFSEFIGMQINDFHRINIDEIQVMVDYLKEWLQKHILIEDVLYCNFIKSTKFNTDSFFKKIKKEKKVTFNKYQSDLYDSIL